jgi:glycosyltransferase involved in cell wall biosynthesis
VKPLVSVVLCTYNQADYLVDAVESVLSQTYTEVELIVIDNGSTDCSAQLLRRYESRRDVRLLLHPQNGSVNERLNQAINLSRGEYVSLLYADDYYLPHKLEKEVAAFAGLPAEYGVVYSPGYRLNVLTGERWVDSHIRVSGNILRDLLIQFPCNVNPISPLVRRSCYAKYPYRADMFFEAEAIYFRFALSYRFHHLDEPLVVMREHMNNAGKALRRNLETTLTWLARLEEEPDFPQEYCADLTRCRARMLRDIGWQAVRTGEDGRWARGCLRRAVGWQPVQLFHPRTAAAFCLSYLPMLAAGLVNKGINRLRARKDNVVFVQDYRP